MRILNFPARIHLELTPLCNLNCHMCPRHFVEDINDMGYMKPELWYQVIDEIVATNPETVVLPFWRGESLMHPQFHDLIRYAVDRGVRIHISTNGHFVTGELAQTLELCEFVTFSIHNTLGYKRAVEFVKNKGKKYPTTQVSFVSSEKTVEKYLYQLTNSGDLGGFDSVRLYQEHTVDGVYGSTGNEPTQPRTFCSKLEDTLVIAYNGSISRCNYIWDTEDQTISVGAVSIKEVWNGPLLSKIRAMYPDKQCAGCDQWLGNTRGQSWRKVADEVRHTIIG